MTSPDNAEPIPQQVASLGELVVGDHVEAWVGSVSHCSGTVETIAADLGVLWIREDRIGARRLLDVREHRIHHRSPHPTGSSLRIGDNMKSDLPTPGRYC